jgi:hypothetical protein
MSGKATEDVVAKAAGILDKAREAILHRHL